MAQPSRKHDVKVAVIGGGTGSFMLLSALKKYTNDIVALVNMVDDGGSSGILRDELGTLPPGDVRQCLVALSDAPKLRDLFNYRFDEGTLSGHSFGNLFLTALEKLTGNFGEGVELASRVLNITGQVEPITFSSIRLATQFRDGRTVYGENVISQTPIGIEKGQPFWLEPNAKANPRAIEAIDQADIVIMAPGSIYGSLGPSLMVEGVGRALHRSRALKVYVCNLVTKPGQTTGYEPVDFAEELERLAGTPFIDVVLVNTEPITSKLIARYASDGEQPVKVGDDVTEGPYDIVGAPLLSSADYTSERNMADRLAQQRTLIRHDGDAVVQAILSLYSGV